MIGMCLRLSPELMLMSDKKKKTPPNSLCSTFAKINLKLSYTIFLLKMNLLIFFQFFCSIDETHFGGD